jgi:PKD repeat protein
MKKIYSIFILAFFVFIQTSLANTTSCSAQFTFTVSNNTVQFISASSTDSSLINTWYFGDGVSSSSLANPSHTFSNCGTYTVFHQVEQFDNNGNLICQDSTFQVVTIICNTPCNAVASFSAVMVNNQTNLYEFVNNSSVTPNSSILCNWNFGDGLIDTTQNLNNQVHTYGASGFYNVCLVITSGTPGTTNTCSDTFCMNVQVQVNTTPCNLTANFTSATTSSPNTISFLNTSTGFAAGDSIRWIFGDGSVSYDLNPTHTFASAGNYIVCLRLVNNTLGAPPCVSEYCQLVTIVDSTPCNISPSFTYQISPNQNNLYVFTNTSVASTPITMVNWHFGDGTIVTLNNPTHLFTASGTYNVCMQVMTANGCTADTCATIVITATPTPCNLVPSFNYSPAPNQNNTFLFTNTTLTANAPQVTWTFGDSTTATGNVVTHSFTDPGTYWVCMHVVASNTCVADTCMMITVSSNPQPCNLNASFTWQSSSASPNVIYFLNTSLGYAPGDSIIWNFGDGTTSYDVNPVHTFSNAGAQNVCLRIVKGLNTPGAPLCASEMCQPVNVMATLIAYPNPATDVVNVNLTLDSTTQVIAYLYNAQNVFVAQNSFTGFSGNNTITFNTSNLAPGYYFIRIYYNGQFIVARFLKI